MNIELLLLAGVGLAAGLLGGMLGVGGSIVMIPALTELFGPDQHLYQAAAMIVNFFVAVPAMIQHRRARAIDSTTVVRLIPFSIFGVLLGVGLSELSVFSGSGEAYLRGLFGLFLIGLCISDLFAGVRSSAATLVKTGSSKDSDRSVGQSAATHSGRGEDREDGDSAAGTKDPQRWKWHLAAVVAFPTGLVAGLLGVGGGTLAVPLQRRFLSVPIRSAIANSAAMILATSAMGSAFKNYACFLEEGGFPDSIRLALVLIPAAVIGSSIGSRLTHRLPIQVVKRAFSLLLLFVALRLMYSAFRSVGVT